MVGVVSAFAASPIDDLMAAASAVAAYCGVVIESLSLSVKTSWSWSQTVSTGRLQPQPHANPSLQSG